MDVSRANNNDTLDTFLGPNLFISPPSALTPPHIDGGGIVEAVHVCVQGHNEVVMTRQLMGEDLVQANEIVHSGSSITNDPHDETATFTWPTEDTFQLLCEAGFRPVRLILGPNEMIILNKGVLHMFRKMSTHSLHPSDCHYHLREQKLKELGEQAEHINNQLHISIAWDNCFGFENCGEDAVRTTFDYLKETMQSKTFHEISKKKGTLVSPKTSIHMLCQFLINECNEFTNIEEPQNSARLEKLRALIPVDISMLEDELKFFNNEEYQTKNIPVDKVSDENDEIHGNTMKSCEVCYGEIFNVYLMRRKGRKFQSVCPDCARGLSNRLIKRDTCQIGFKFYNKKYLEHMIDGLKQSMSDL